MSFRAQHWAFGHPDCQSSSQQLTLMAYANYANQHDCAYLAAETIASKVKLDIKTVRACVSWLEHYGLLIDTGRRVGRTGQIKVYRLAIEAHPNADVLPAEGSDEGAEDAQKPRVRAVQASHPKSGSFKGDRISGKAARKRETEPVTNPAPPDEAKASSPPQGGKRDRGKSIPADWRPISIAELPPRAAALVRSWPSGAYDAEAEAFANWARGADHRRADWAAAWCSWIIRVTGKVLRDGKAGVRHAASSAPDTRSPSELAQAALQRADVYAKLGRDEEAAQARSQATRYQQLADAGGG